MNLVMTLMNVWKILVQKAITEASIKEFIEGLNVSEDIKKELRVITPHTYTGI